MNPDTILHGDCTNVMRRIADRSVDFVLTDPPYLCNYRSRDGETVRNDRRETGSIRPSGTSTGS